MFLIEVCASCNADWLGAPCLDCGAEYSKVVQGTL